MELADTITMAELRKTDLYKKVQRMLLSEGLEMNAYELADKLEAIDTTDTDMLNSANMLRQQADRIAELEKQSEPVTYLKRDESTGLYYECDKQYGFPVYTTPQDQANRIAHLEMLVSNRNEIIDKLDLKPKKFRCTCGASIGHPLVPKCICRGQ
jgi:hypothetical protein